MDIDKSWIGRPRNTIEYLDGLEVFLDYAFTNGCIRDTIKCPCPKCGFRKWQRRDVVRDHLICKPFPRTYEIWTFHGEKTIPQSTRNIDIVQDEVHSNIDTQALCQKNATNRKQQKVKHIRESKSNAKRRNELSILCGNPVGRAHAYLDTRKRKDGSWVNDAAREEEKIERELNQNPSVNYSISPNDAVGKTLGMEHSGRARCMGLGVTPTSSFGNTSLYHHGFSCSTFSGESSYTRNEDRLVYLESRLNDMLNAFKTYILSKEGSIPAELASIFNPPQSTRLFPLESRHASHNSEEVKSSSASN